MFILRYAGKFLLHPCYADRQIINFITTLYIIITPYFTSGHQSSSCKGACTDVIRIQTQNDFCCFPSVSITNSVDDVSGSPLGQRDFEFFGRKILAVSPMALNFGLLIGGTNVHPLDLFEFTRFPVTREIDDIRQNFGIFSGEMDQGTVTNFSPRTTLGAARTAHLIF